MPTPTLPTITTLPTLPSSTLTSVLDTLFEPSPPLHDLSLPLLQQTPFPSYPSLINAIGAQLTSLLSSTSPSTLSLDKILAAHPRLGAPKVDSAQSAAEQAQLRGGGDDDDATQTQQLAALNAEYEATFPGLRYVVFVNGRSRDVIMDDMRSRIRRGDPRAEREEAIKAMCEIAVDRARKLV